MDPHRVLVALAPDPGSPELAGFTERARHRIREDLLSSSLSARPYLDEDIAGEGSAPLGLRRKSELIKTTSPYRIGTIVVGLIREAPDGPLVEADVMEAPSGRILFSLSVRGERASDEAILDRLSERILGALAIPLGDAPVDLLPIVGRPPTYTAYQALVEGMRAYAAGDDGGARQQYVEAVTADPDFVLPRLELATMVAFGEGGDRAHVIALLDSLGFESRTLSEVERMHLEWIPPRQWVQREDRLWLVGRRELAELSKRAPERYLSLWASAEWLAGNDAEAAELLARVDPDRNLVRNYDFVLSEALHALGRYKEYLAFIDQYEETRGSLNMTFKHLGALGDTTRIFEYLQERVAMNGPRAAPVARVAARELACHGHPRESSAVLEWAASEVQPMFEGPPVNGFAADVVDIFYMLGDLDRVEAAYDYWERGGWDPDHSLTLQGRGRLAAERGERDTAEYYMARIRDLDVGDRLKRQAVAQIQAILDPPVAPPPSDHCVAP